jgi:hypothetical protein
MDNSDCERKSYLPPDYTGHPTEDDDDDDYLIDEEVDEEEVKLYNLMEQQENLVKKEMAETTPNPFSWGSSGTGSGTGSSKAPWEKAEDRKPWSPAGGFSGWGSGSSSSGWKPASEKSAPWKKEETPAEQEERKVKRAIICDVLDCLYESWESNGKPDIMPRAVFDLKPRFDVWDKLASFAPQKIYVIMPAPELIPSFGNRESSEAALEYIAHSVTTYLRIPRQACVVMKQMREGIPKERTVSGAISDWKNLDDLVYIGTHSGRWGLSSRDKDAAHNCMIDYIDLYNLLEGKYIYE